MLMKPNVIGLRVCNAYVAKFDWLGVHVCNAYVAKCDGFRGM